MNLDELRTQLDTIDNQIVRLLSQRAEVILQVADVKKQNGLPVHVPEREDAILSRLRRRNPGPLDGEAIERIYRLIIDEMRNFEDEHVVR
jgi:chorismate mutase-like protein